MTPLDMDVEIRDQWVARLRSGEIEQVSTGLAFGAKRCCLGVLCDLAVEAGVIEPPWPDTTTDDDCWLIYANQQEYLPDSVAEWAGLDDSNPALPDGSLLSYLNDHGYDFADIADLIEGRER